MANGIQDAACAREKEKSRYIQKPNQTTTKQSKKLDSAKSIVLL